MPARSLVVVVVAVPAVRSISAPGDGNDDCRGIFRARKPTCPHDDDFACACLPLSPLIKTCSPLVNQAAGRLRGRGRAHACQRARSSGEESSTTS